jgi:hypothetical protein
MGKDAGRATLGFSVHTGWAALIAVAGTPASPVILERRRVDMIAGSEPDSPRFVYHAAQNLASLGAAERCVREAVELSCAKAMAAIEHVVRELGERNYDVAGSGIVVGSRPLTADLATILESHALIHAAEGALFRAAIKSASERLKIPVMEIHARELPSRAARVLKIPVTALPERLAQVGRAAGRPWSKDQKDSFLAALLASV